MDADDASDGHETLCRLAGVAARLFGGDGPYIHPGHAAHEVRRTAGTYVILPSNKKCLILNISLNSLLFQVLETFFLIVEKNHSCSSLIKNDKEKAKKSRHSFANLNFAHLLQDPPIKNAVF